MSSIHQRPSSSGAFGIIILLFIFCLFMVINLAVNADHKHNDGYANSQTMDTDYVVAPHPGTK